MFEACQGCQYEEYPYKAQIPVMIDGNRPTWEFKSDEDVWKVVDLIIEEVNESNLKGNEFDAVSSIQAQLPFLHAIIGFTTKKVKKIYKDIYIVKSLMSQHIKVIMDNNPVYG
tara:strand:+ start:1548 stop:1886 length:339 start_codon:yes stop_codon:yes gene_type:complete